MFRYVVTGFTLQNVKCTFNSAVFSTLSIGLCNLFTVITFCDFKLIKYLFPCNTNIVVYSPHFLSQISSDFANYFKIEN